jgi:hypothetical protein
MCSDGASLVSVRVVHTCVLFMVYTCVACVVRMFVPYSYSSHKQENATDPA